MEYFKFCSPNRLVQPAIGKFPSVIIRALRYAPKNVRTVAISRGNARVNQTKVKLLVRLNPRPNPSLSPCRAVTVAQGELSKNGHLPYRARKPAQPTPALQGGRGFTFSPSSTIWPRVVTFLVATSFCVRPLVATPGVFRLMVCMSCGLAGTTSTLRVLLFLASIMHKRFSC